MKLTTYNIKRGILIIALIIPILLIQNAVSSSYEHILIKKLISEKSDEISLNHKEIQNRITTIKSQLDTLNRTSEIPLHSDYVFWEQSELIISGGEDESLISKERALNILRYAKKQKIVLNELENYLYFISQSDNSGRILILKMPVELVFTENMKNPSSHVAIGIYRDNEIIYQTNNFVAPETYTADYTELIQTKSQTLLISHRRMEQTALSMVITYDLTDSVLFIKDKVLSYEVIMLIVLMITSFFFLSFGYAKEDPIQSLYVQLSLLNEGLKQKKISKSLLRPVETMPMWEDVEVIGEKGLKLINQINEINLQIRQLKNESVQSVENQNIVNEMIAQLEEELALSNKIKNAFTNFVDQVLIMVDTQLFVREVNDAYTLKTGYEAEDVIGNPITSFIIESFEGQLVQRLEKLTDEPLFINIKHKNQSESVSEFVSFRCIQWEDDKVLLIGKSIHEEITLQSRILRKNRELEYINQINSSLISNWGFDELLDNIIRRIDYLFSIEIGTIYVRENNEWALKSSASALEFREDQYLSHFDEQSFSQNSELKMIAVEALNDLENPFSAKVKYLVVAPLEVENDIIAVMLIGIENKMKASDLNVLRMFKNQASIVIQRSILYDQLREQYFNTIEALVNVIEAKDKYTEGHSRRVSRFSVEIAQEMGYSNEEIENIEIAGLLHDVGKVGIKQNILNKRGKLTDEEYEIIKEHPEKGIQILRTIKLDNKIMEGIHYHHVHYDLSGYPKDHNLTSLPDYAAIIGVADAFDAISSARSYTKPRTVNEAVQELKRCEKTQFSPEVVSAMTRLVDKSLDRIQDIVNDLRS
jgi:putative nucleotidyltransferase with HDIG domain